MNTLETPLLAALRDHRRLFISTGAVVVTGWLGDFLFWSHVPGLSLGIFAALLGFGIWTIGKRTASGALALAALNLTAVQSGIEICFTNVFCLFVFLVAVAGEAYYAELAGIWARWSEGLLAACLAPFRSLMLLHEWCEVRLLSRRGEGAVAPAFERLVLAMLPAAIVALVFTCLLRAGNAVFAEGLARLGHFFFDWLTDLSLPRALLWFVWLGVGVAFFRPLAQPGGRFWVRAIGPWERSDSNFARCQSGLLLAAVNALFFAVNSIDVVYLWASTTLPAGVTASRFVHSGVYSLIAATVLAGGVLAVIFQQGAAVSRSGWLRGLALLWIGQNILLIAGVFRRLDLYVEFYQLSELRVYVGCFLLLVSVGYTFLARHVWMGLKLEKLIFSNALATVALLFGLQFCDVGTWVANWNVAQWTAHPDRALDVEYLVRLGPRGWPALLQVAQGTGSVSRQAGDALREIIAEKQAAAGERDWRSFQARRDGRTEQLLHAQLPRR